MKMKDTLLGLVLMAALGAAGAQAGSYDTSRVFDPGKLKGSGPGKPNELMVLGSAHLAQLPKTAPPAALANLVERLASWQPRIIAIEAMSGMQCDWMRSYPERYADAVKAYCWDPAPARQATGLDVPAATRETDALLAKWPLAPSASQRRLLASRFLAAGEPVSALVQWLRLPQSEQHAGDGLDATLVALLETLRSARSEDKALAAPLAAKLGLERVTPMDDQAENLPVDDEAAYGAAIAQAWNNPANAERSRAEALLQREVDSGDGLITLYRALNDPRAARKFFDTDFGAALQEPSRQAYGRVYVGYWETRNLRMAANIREAIGAHPGGRTLVIVGASHKWYLQSYLNQMHDVRVVDVAPLLR